MVRKRAGKLGIGERWHAWGVGNGYGGCIMWENEHSWVLDDLMIRMEINNEGRRMRKRIGE